MKKLLFLLLFLPFLGNSQATFTAPVGYNTGAPTATPSGVGTRWRFDLLTGKKYTWLPGSLSWDEDARGIDQVAGCSAPLYTPGYNQSTFAVNSCTPPVLYQWTGAAWEIPNEPEVYTAGMGISIDGSNVITNTAPNVVQTLSIAGQDLTLSNGGGTVAIPGGSSLGTGFTAGGGMGAIPAGTSSTTVLTGDWNTRTLFGVPSKYEENVGDGFNCFGIESYNETDNDYWFIGNTDDDPGSLTFFRNKVGSFLGSFGISSSGVFLTSDLNARFEGGFGGFNMTAAGHTFIDKNASELGIEYAADYSATIAANPRSIPDVGTVNSLKQKLATYTTTQRNAINTRNRLRNFLHRRNRNRRQHRRNAGV